MKLNDGVKKIEKTEPKFAKKLENILYTWNLYRWIIEKVNVSI